MKKKKKNYIEAAAGAALIAITVGDIIPGDEIPGVPIGLALIIDGMGWL